MRREQLEHAIRTACQIIGHDEVAVVGSQSILGSFAEDQLPAEATMSMEIDVLPLWTTMLKPPVSPTSSRAWRASGPRFIGWCLDKEDLCVAKLCAFREKDQNFVAALLEAGLVNADVISGRLPTVPEHHVTAAERATAWLTAWRYHTEIDKP